jgi:hypothetical protein
MVEGQWLPTMAWWLGDFGATSRQLSLDLGDCPLGALYKPIEPAPAVAEHLRGACGMRRRGQLARRGCRVWADQR